MGLCGDAHAAYYDHCMQFRHWLKQLVSESNEDERFSQLPRFAYKEKVVFAWLGGGQQGAQAFEMFVLLALDRPTLGNNICLSKNHAKLQVKLIVRNRPAKARRPYWTTGWGMAVLLKEKLNPDNVTQVACSSIRIYLGTHGRMPGLGINKT